MRTLLIAATIVCGMVVNITMSNAMSGSEYRETAIALFKEFLLMENDGVFFSSKKIAELEKYRIVLPNNIRGESAPGGFYARPPGSDWLKRAIALRDVEIDSPEACFDIPHLPFPDMVCGVNLLNFTVDTDDPKAINALASKFWLATICNDAPEVCQKYLNP